VSNTLDAVSPLEIGLYLLWLNFAEIPRQQSLNIIRRLRAGSRFIPPSVLPKSYKIGEAIRHNFQWVSISPGVYSNIVITKIVVAAGE
jgi:hypothetical protein